MKSSREIREEKYPKLFNHLKTMQGITEEQREICLNDFYEMDEERAGIWDLSDIGYAFLWDNTVAGRYFWADIYRIQEENK